MPGQVETLFSHLATTNLYALAMGALTLLIVFGFPKNERSNIDKDEAEALKKLAAHLLSLTPQAIGKAQRAGELMEVDCDAQDEVTHP